MAVTYNWSYKPGVANKYGFSVAASADDVKPSNCHYIAPWGNDTTGNGSRMKPYRTVQNRGANNVGILGSGVYRMNSAIIFTSDMYGDGNVIFDFSFAGNIVTDNRSLFNLKFIGSGSTTVSIGGQNVLRDCIFDKCAPTGQNYMTNCLVSNFDGSFALGSGVNVGKRENCTFYRCRSIIIGQVALSNNISACIFDKCNISYQNTFINTNYSLFYQCNIRFNATAGTTSPVYPNVPAGYTNYTSLGTMIADAMSAFPTASNPFEKCAVSDPKFNNTSIDDFTLGFDSPARNMSYFGTYIGNYSITRSLAVRASSILSAFDNSSAINLSISDNSLTLVDVESIASIVTKPIDNTLGRELQRLHTFGINADRNGEYVDSTADLANTTISAGTTLSVSTPYTVESGAITYDGGVYNAGQRFTSKSSSPGTFTTSTGGVVREILEAPARENLEARFSDGALTTVDNTATLEELAWYFVEGNAVTYNGNSYAVGAFLKVLTGITSFTGTGLLRKVFSDTDPYFYFEINQKPTSNNVGNSRTGAIVRGNGDKDFDRTAANVFPINKKFIQLRYTIQVNNLTP
jgi:hypothetical protein